LWQGKSRPFSSPLAPIESIGTIDGRSEAKKGGEAKPNFVIGKVFFEQFKHTGEEKGDCEGSCSVGEVESHKIDEVQESRKRRNPFQGLSSYLNYLKQFVHMIQDQYAMSYFSMFVI
jgi:hypothetical protein